MLFLWERGGEAVGDTDESKGKKNKGVLKKTWQMWYGMTRESGIKEPIRQKEDH
jgi:hypothetical protein